MVGALTAMPAPIPIEEVGAPVPVAEPSAVTWLAVLLSVATLSWPVTVTITLSGTAAMAEDVTTPTPIAAATETPPSVVEAERLSAVEDDVCFERCDVVPTFLLEALPETELTCVVVAPSTSAASPEDFWLDDLPPDAEASASTVLRVELPAYSVRLPAVMLRVVVAVASSVIRASANAAPMAALDPTADESAVVVAVSICVADAETAPVTVNAPVCAPIVAVALSAA